MRKFYFHKYCYLFLWLGLFLAVGGVWLLNSFQKPSEAPSPSPVSRTSSSALKEQKAASVPAEEELKGLWVPYLSLAGEPHTPEAFRERFQAIAGSAAEKGINALFVHVRPFCDALYPSKLYPWSHLLTGEQGKDPGFDPLEFMVNCTHELGMEFHAWLNPLRVKTAETPAELSEESPYLSLEEDAPYYFMEYQGAVYLNPASPYIRTLIAQGAAEIVKAYPVDGVHFDDYFYPVREDQEPQLDQEAYELYCQSVELPLTLSQWRTANISAMVEEVYRAVKKERPEAAFGISPQGNIENDKAIGADVEAWCAVEGYVDYICPQLYYSFENQALGYSEALARWQALPKHEGLKLYTGLALYKAGSDADGGTWLLENDILKRQVEEARSAGCTGFLLYSSEYLDAEQTSEEVAHVVALLQETAEKAA